MRRSNFMHKVGVPGLVVVGLVGLGLVLAAALAQEPAALPLAPPGPPAAPSAPPTAPKPGSVTPPGIPSGKALAEEDYKGFTIKAVAMSAGGEHQLAGAIEKEIGGELKTYNFVRADKFSSRDDATAMSLAKGRQLVDEQGDGLVAFVGLHHRVHVRALDDNVALRLETRADCLLGVAFEFDAQAPDPMDELAVRRAARTA